MNSSFFHFKLQLVQHLPAHKLNKPLLRQKHQQVQLQLVLVEVQLQLVLVEQLQLQEELQPLQLVEVSHQYQ